MTVTNPYLKPGTAPFAALSDGTPLYPAYHPLCCGERRRAKRFWAAQVGAWVGVTADGRLFRQTQSWGGEGPEPERWEAFCLGH